MPRQLPFLIALSYIWFGMVLAISFLEAPLKFQAEGVTLPIGLGIGRLVFRALNHIELVFAVLTLGLVTIGYIPKRITLLLNGVWLMLGLQTVWLRPILNERGLLVLQGQTPPPAHYHLSYIGLEVVKLLGLLAVGVLGLRALSRSYQEIE